jgi:hypothetical protein
MLWITLSKLRETKPARECIRCLLEISADRPVLYIAAFSLFAAAQVVFFLASQPLCKVRPQLIFCLRAWKADPEGIRIKGQLGILGDVAKLWSSRRAVLGMDGESPCDSFAASRMAKS